MKISKLFHWLYAILMLLPFAFFVPSILYYAFNDNATMQSVEVPKTETISVDFNQQVKNGEFSSTDEWVVYSYPSSFNVQNNTIGVTNSGYNFTSLAQWIDVSANHKYYVRYSIQTNNDVVSYIRVPAPSLNASVNINDNAWHTFSTIVTPSINGSIIEFLTSSVGSLTSYSVSYTDINIFDLTKMFGVGNEPTVQVFDDYFPSAFYPYNESELMQITYDTGETEQLVSNTYIINYAWESIWDLPLFSWCKVSFVATPFTYITGLFGLAASNSFNYVFTYFASMSIIWLVFDVIMYVPLLVHRWLDKGIVE